MKIILLNKGKKVIVDDEDFEFLNKWKWYINNHGYVARTQWQSEKKRCLTIYMHVLINNTPRGYQTDHINHNKLDNRKINLRTANHSQNAININKFMKGKSKYKGVFWYKNDNKWGAQITFKKGKHYLGIFIKETDAAKAYNEKAKELFGEFAYLNNL